MNEYSKQEDTPQNLYDESKIVGLSDSDVESEKSIVPDFSFFFDKLNELSKEVDIDVILRRRITDPNLDKYYNQGEEKARKLSLGRGGLIFYFRTLLAAVKKDLESKEGNGKLIPELPLGGSILEIGGPSVGNDGTALDIAFSGSEKIVFANPDFYGNGELWVNSIKHCFEKEKGLNISSVENINEIIESGRTFDFVTSYNVFGQESQEGHYDPYMGIDLSSPEKRNEMLSQIKKVLKPNGLFLNSTLQTGLGFSVQELRDAGFNCPEVRRPDDDRYFFAQYIGDKK